MPSYMSNDVYHQNTQYINLLDIINILSIKNALHIVLPFVVPPGPPVINAAVD